MHLDSVNTSLGLTLLPGAHYVGNIPLIGPVDIGAFASGMLGADGGLPVATGMADCDAAASLSLYVVLQSDAALQIIEFDDTQPIWMSPTSQRSSCAALPMP